MSKFKIGDKVTCIETDEKEAGYNGITYGKTYRVVGIDRVGNENEWLLSLDNGERAFCYRFELAKETEMTAEQLREEILRIDSRIEEAKKDIEKAEKERNSLVEKLREKGFTLLSNEQLSTSYVRPTVGDKVRVCIKDHPYSTFGEVFIIETDDGSRVPYCDSKGNWFKETSVEKI